MKTIVASGAVPKMMMAVGRLASAMVGVKMKAGAWLAALAAHQASAAPLRTAAPPVVAMTSPRTVALALREVEGQPAATPR